MRSLMNFFLRVNLLAWIIGLFVAHLVMYVSLGTPTWFATSLLAVSVYAVFFMVMKMVAQRYIEREREGNQ
ncbi:hypothetical protein JNUCC42_21955 [Brevibacterium sp. JNUCC-42]|uniref:Uncharacterized protein n=1 Tax=Brevibacillus laterosporus TaxID=1465 RepID=A0A502J2J5_BRELA|nr:hypothetical protein [Brevibacillus laterosporus]QOS99024.1 hypothetical protein JNUCC42_21955 [Brevibacterium sp. JNUCC-42]QDX92584.1 hypothetical protein EEL30_09780 [Brevibacillus laterosporus]RAP27889.1 hypothetical protein C2W64_00708 [Brevibacillus laterosporus]TPG70893.1 hypothetical protein EEL31_22245 [Brevibacillus laterosporus]TPG91670.1 hypothetical protein EEL32_02300 [Brevibacillus laterosporus]